MASSSAKGEDVLSALDGIQSVYNKLVTQEVFV
jgi:hypothetical protein